MAGEIANPLSGLVEGMLMGHNLGLQLRKQAMEEQAFKTNQALHDQQMSVQDIMNRQMLQENARPVSDTGSVDNPAGPDIPAVVPGLGPQQGAPAYTRRADAGRTVKYGGQQYELKTPEEQQQQTITRQVNQQNALELAKFQQAQIGRENALKLRGKPIGQEIGSALMMDPNTLVLPEELPGLAEHAATLNKPVDVAQGATAINPRTGKVVYQSAPKLEQEDKYVNDWLQSRNIDPTTATAGQRLLARIEYKHDPTQIAQQQQFHQDSVDNQKAILGLRQTELSNQQRAALDREIQQHSKAFEEISKGADTQLDKILEARKMIAGGAIDQALAVPKILTAVISGNGSGVRITKSEMDAIAKARGITGDIEGWFNKLSGKGALTADQKSQMDSILGDVQQRIFEKKAIARSASDEIMTAGDRKGILDAVKKGRDALDKYATQQSGPAGYQQGYVYGGLEFLGGDPNNQASWQKVR